MCTLECGAAASCGSLSGVRRGRCDGRSTAAADHRETPETRDTHSVTFFMPVPFRVVDPSRRLEPQSARLFPGIGSCARCPCRCDLGTVEVLMRMRPGWRRQSWRRSPTDLAARTTAQSSRRASRLRPILADRLAEQQRRSMLASRRRRRGRSSGRVARAPRGATIRAHRPHSATPRSRRSRRCRGGSRGDRRRWSSSAPARAARAFRPRSGRPRSRREPAARRH